MLERKYPYYICRVTSQKITNLTVQKAPLSSTIPFYAMSPPATPATTQQIDISLDFNASGVTLFYMNGESFRGNYDHPVLLLAKLGNVSYPYDPQWNVYNFGSNSSIRFVIRNTTPLAHPMHLHGHNFWVLAEGTGTWDGVVTNAQNPQRRDVQLLDKGAPDAPHYIVMEILADNPGVWPLHCHISWCVPHSSYPSIQVKSVRTNHDILSRHVSNGLYINVLERPDDIKKLDMPSTIAQTCRDWADFSGHTVVDQIDSGL